MNKEEKLNLNAGDYAIRHCIIDQTYNGLEVHKMLCDAYIAGNNDTLDDEDERIRKELLEHCKNQAEPYIQTGNKCPQIQSWIAWLEKQGELPIYNIPLKEVILSIWDLGNEWKELTNGCISTEYGTQLDYIQKHWQESEYYLRAMQDEQKPTDKIEPKFKVGDWIVQKGLGIYKIVEVCESWYEVISYKDGIQYSIGFDKENDCHLWTIQDAKDGDVLYINNTLSESIMIYKSFNNGVINKYASYNKFGFEGENYLTLNDGYIVPATKEQRNLLFEKMKEAGYEWDAELKQLRKIEQKSITMSLDEAIEHCKEKSCGNNACALEHKQLEKWLTELKELKEQKPAEWSEKDEEQLDRAIYMMEQLDMTKSWDDVYNWLKSLKDRVLPQPKQEWSEEDELQMQAIIDLLPGLTNRHNWLKSLKDRIQPQPKQEWSEEDNYYRNHIIQIIEEINNAPLKRREDWESYINWLKSLRPQNRWKPSDEQISVIEAVINNRSFQRRHLDSLYEQLKKLK